MCIPTAQQISQAIHHIHVSSRSQTNISQASIAIDSPRHSCCRKAYLPTYTHSRHKEATFYDMMYIYIYRDILCMYICIYYIYIGLYTIQSTCMMHIYISTHCNPVCPPLTILTRIATILSWIAAWTAVILSWIASILSRIASILSRIAVNLSRIAAMILSRIAAAVILSRIAAVILSGIAVSMSLSSQTSPCS